MCLFLLNQRRLSHKNCNYLHTKQQPKISPIELEQDIREGIDTSCPQDWSSEQSTQTAAKNATKTTASVQRWSAMQAPHIKLDLGDKSSQAVTWMIEVDDMERVKSRRIKVTPWQRVGPHRRRVADGATQQQCSHRNTRNTGAAASVTVKEDHSAIAGRELPSPNLWWEVSTICRRAGSFSLQDLSLSLSVSLTWTLHATARCWCSRWPPPHQRRPLLELHWCLA